MNKWILGVMLAALVIQPAAADLPSHNTVRQIGNQLPGGGQAAQIGSWIVDAKKHILKATYSVSRDTGSVGTSVALKGVDGLRAVVPKNAVVTNAWVDVLGAPSPASGSTVLALHLQDNNDIIDPKPHASVTGILTGKFSSVAPVKMRSNRNVSVGVTGATLVNGKFNVFIEYLLSDDAL